MHIAEYRQVKVTKDRDILTIEKLDIKEGTRYAIVGPSGSGKSTFLRLTNFLEKPSSGEMKLFGEEVKEGLPGKKLIEMQRQMVYVSQKPVMFDMSVADNLAMGLKYRGIPKREAKDRMEEFLQAVGLAGYQSRRATTLSGGEAQRVALARALIVHPKLLLLDEPTSNLDPSNIQIIEEVVNRIHQELGVAVMMVTHNLQQARRIGDEIIFIHQGKVMEKQDQQKFFEQPKTKELQDFITGRMIY